jgi:ferritin-like metal-binding protein YciE
MFAADAAAVESGRFPFLPHEQPHCYVDGRSAEFYAGQSVEWLNQNCYATLTRMAERYGSIVQELRTTPLPTVDQAQLKSMFTQHLNDAEVQADLTVMTLPAARVPGS